MLRKRFIKPPYSVEQRSMCNSNAESKWSCKLLSGTFGDRVTTTISIKGRKSLENLLTEYKSEVAVPKQKKTALFFFLVIKGRVSESYYAVAAQLLVATKNSQGVPTI